MIDLRRFVGAAIMGAALLAPTVAVAREPGLAFGDWTILASDVAERLWDKLGEVKPRPLTAQEGSQVGATPELTDYMEARILSRIPEDIQPYFDLLLYVSRATEGPYSQRLYVYERSPDGLGFRPYAQWLVSTGREQEEKYWTGTPDGMFKLDPNRMQEMRVSYQWGTPMPWTMFWDAEFNGKLTGYAIHGAGDDKDIQQLGQRASAGCVRLHPEQAADLFRKVRRETWGKVPVFPYDRFTDSTALDGRAKRRADGSIMLTRGYRTLLVIENFSGGPETPVRSDTVATAY